MKVALLAGRQVASPLPCQHFLMSPLVRMCGRSGAREAGAHLSQALEEGAGAATGRSFFWGVGRMWLIGVTESCPFSVH